jgi:hypothetical protein
MTAMEAAMQQPGESAGLSQVERVVDTFVAPTKTFTDIRRNASWWLPFLLLIVVSAAFSFSIDRKVGFDQVAQTNIDRNASAQQNMSNLPEAQREQTIHRIGSFTKVVSYLYPVLGLIFALICAGILMLTFNFGLGAKASFKEYLAVWFYASLPFLIKFLLAAAAIFAGASAEHFDINNPVGTNVGWYLSSDVPLWVRTLFSSADVFTLWVVLLLILGCSIVAKVKRSSAAIVIIGWWVLIILGGTITAAIQG